MKKKFSALALLAALSLLLSACGQTRADTQDNTTASVSDTDIQPDMQENSEATPEENTAEISTEMPEAAETVPQPAPEPAEQQQPEAQAAAPKPEPDPEAEPEPAASALSGATLTMQFAVGDAFTIHLYDNETAAKIAEYVGTADWQLPIYHYDDYDNWEVMQYYDIPRRYDIPSNPQNVTSEKAGTVYYSHPNRIILFYQDAEVSSEYTPVGYVDFSQALVDAVNNNPVVEGWGNKLVFIRP